ncbi:hypothetical protein F5880DRAFT_129263 [Lentinula raphanica]|nr:hypothetical protein F5880DRAFT_129263 [Lentinula raphanica]
MQYYVVIGKQGPRVEGVLDELAGHHFSQDGFNSRAEAEYCINILKATTSWLPDDPITNEPLARYPNPLTHGGELPPMPARSMNNASSSTSTGNLQPAIADSVPPDHAPGNSIQLSSEQRQVLETVKAGGNVFFTGPADSRCDCKYRDCRCKHQGVYDTLLGWHRTRQGANHETR